MSDYLKHDSGEVFASPFSEAQKETALRLRFLTPHGDLADAWEAVLWRNALYVRVATRQMSAPGSRGSFVALLEAAEDRLGCHAVVACVNKNEDALRSMIKSFLFLGFQRIDEGSKLFPSDPNLVECLLI
jgi:hypothetical protein